MKLYVDLDGVLADFDWFIAKNNLTKQSLWPIINYRIKKGWTVWGNLPLMSDAMELWDFVKDKDPTILTATGLSGYDYVSAEKRGWCLRHLGDVDVITVETGREKAASASEGDILIDDRIKNIEHWITAGGVGILHTSAADTIKELKKLGF